MYQVRKWILILILQLTKAHLEHREPKLMQKHEFITYKEYCHRYTFQCPTDPDVEVVTLQDNSSAYILFISVEQFTTLVGYLDKIPTGRILTAKNVLGLAQRIFPNIVYVLVEPKEVSEEAFELLKLARTHNNPEGAADI